MLTNLFPQQLHRLLRCAEMSGKSMYIVWDRIDWELNSSDKKSYPPCLV